MLEFLFLQNNDYNVFKKLQYVISYLLNFYINIIIHVVKKYY